VVAGAFGDALLVEDALNRSLSALPVGTLGGVARH
jgi:hypothetical protein